MPVLRSLIIGDLASSWAAGGFDVRHDRGRASTRIGAVEIELVGPDDGRGIIAWRFDADELPSSLDGITTLRAIPDGHGGAASKGGSEPSHENRASGLDHVVMMTPDLTRTVGALEAAGFEARRTRNVPGPGPARQQVFFWAGQTIIELVGPVEATGDEPATLWGLAITSDDLDAAHEALGDRLDTPKPAVQPGRRIATLRTRDLDISTAIALMSPHVG